MRAPGRRRRVPNSGRTLHGVSRERRRPRGDPRKSGAGADRGTRGGGKGSPVSALRVLEESVAPELRMRDACGQRGRHRTVLGLLMSERALFVASGIAGALAVVLGAFGAHA